MQGEIMLTLRPADLTPRGRVWNAVRTLVLSGEPIAAETIARKYPDICGQTVRRHMLELAEDGVLRKARRGKFEVVDLSRWQQPDARSLTGAPPASRYVRRTATIQIPATYDGLWAVMLWLDRERRCFSLRLLCEVSQGVLAREDIQAYLTRLDRAGYIRRTFALCLDPVWRVARRQGETPLFRADGRPLSQPMRAAHMWRAMKMCGYFTTRDLAIAASLPELPVSEEQAARYIRDLVVGGYLIARDGPTGAMYRLKSGMNTGPAAPRVLSARFVWDPNTQRIMGDLIASEVKR